MAQQPQKRVPGAQRAPRKAGQGNRPRISLIILGVVLVIVGAVLFFQNYSNNSGVMWAGIMVGLVGAGVTLFGPSRHSEVPPPNGNHGRA